MYSMWTIVLHLFETSQMKRMLKVLCQVAIPYKINLKKKSWSYYLCNFDEMLTLNSELYVAFNRCKKLLII